MTNIASTSRLVVAIVVVLLAACDQPRMPTAPTRRPLLPASTSPRPTLPPVGAGEFPALAGPARLYLEVGGPVYRTPSRYALYEDGRFAFQLAGGTYESGGTYREANGIIAFAWNNRDWSSSGGVMDDLLTVSYNSAMQLSDFVDGVYTRTN